jgi:molecular chaperone GrpE
MPGEKKIKIEGGDEIQGNRAADNAEPSDSAKIDQDETTQLDPNDASNINEQDPIKFLEDRLESVTKESQENYDRLLRVSAEFDNYKKRSARELADVQKYANQSLVKDLLPIIDSLELALKSAAESTNQADGCLLDGVELTRKEILKVFENNNIEQVVAIGKPFDPNFHEAVMREESDEYPENTVINELQKGYLMHDRLIRPAMVIVAMPKGNQLSGSGDPNA